MRTSTTSGTTTAFYAIWTRKTKTATPQVNASRWILLSTKIPARRAARIVRVAPAPQSGTRTRRRTRVTMRRTQRYIFPVAAKNLPTLADTSSTASARQVAASAVSRSSGKADLVRPPGQIGTALCASESLGLPDTRAPGDRRVRALGTQSFERKSAELAAFQ